MNLLNKMDEKCSIKTCYSKLEQIFNEADSYYETWRSYQSLWDIEQSHVYDLLGDNIDRWNQMLNEIRQGRKTFDTSEDFKCFGGIEISYGTVQGKVNNKYD
jgi:dynein heavy chain 1